MLPKELFWIGAKGGLLAEKHYYAMRDAIWLFQWLLLRQTGVSEAEEGIVNYGHPITREEITTDTGFADWRVKRWTDRLRRTDYIRTEKRGNDGLIFFVLAAKHKTKRGRDRAKMLPPTAQVGALMSPPDKNVPTYVPQNEIDKALASLSISKGLSYLNKDAAAKAAAGVSSLSIEEQKQELRRRGHLQ